MNVLKTLGVVAAVVVGLVAWDMLKPEGGVDAVVETLARQGDGGQGTHGFVDIPMPDGMSSRGVVVFAPDNCPQDAGQRAQALADYLRAQGVPHTRATRAEYNNLSSAEEASKVMAVMNGAIPIVYVNGRARANPSPQDVVAEFRRRAPG